MKKDNHKLHLKIHKLMQEKLNELPESRGNYVEKVNDIAIRLNSQLAFLIGVLECEQIALEQEETEGLVDILTFMKSEVKEIMPL